MFLPFRDDNPHDTVPVVTYAIIAACVGVFLWQLSLGGKDGEVAVFQYGVIPASLFGTNQLDPSIAAVPPWMTIFTSMFMHGGWMHLIGNMMYLWIFGDNIEASLGRGRYIVFYLLCGIAAALVQSVAMPSSTVPMIGASGAISGVLGGYMILHPRANIRVFVWFIIYISVWNLPAWVVLGGWFLMQLWSSAGVSAGEPGVAFLAHIGGFIAGAVLVPFFKKRGVPLFEPAHTKAFAMEKRPIRRRSRGSVPNVGGRRGPWG